MADDDDTREPDAVSGTNSAQAGQSQKQDSTPALAAEFVPPDYEAMNARISETRKQAGPPLPEGEASPAALERADEEEEIGPTDPS
ncbi:hypothetical protein ACFORG_20665 [Lutimaribacter marinistellae]|uniref:Uncharacterized protein n=1 Tax=Lutimaribacter marinistellae TaxID=1820329 RepID=A0ABV7TKN1_9RHOB